MPDSTGRGHGNQWWIAAAILIALLAMCAAIGAVVTDPTEAIRAIIRATARTSLVLFMLAFSAAGLARVSGAPWTRALRANRRQIGIGFALSHLLHAAALVALALRDPALFDALTTPASFIFGGAAYLVILAMLATSFDATARLIGPSAWARLHTGGSWFLWLMFVINFGKRLPAHPSYLVAIGVALLALAVRRAGRRKGATGEDTLSGQGGLAT